jgi:peptidoglycan-N-acetylglucosamine deacetylase
MKKAYLTIDDVPSKYFEDKIDFLKKNAIPAILFCIGNGIDNNINCLAGAVKNGFILGNHSFSHPHFSDLSDDESLAEIKNTDDILTGLYKLAGIPWDKKYFRFPFLDRGGNINARDYENGIPASNRNKVMKIQDFLKQLGYVKPDFRNITYKAYHDISPDCFIDAVCTFDQSEYYYGNKNAPYGLGEENAILQRIEEDFPEQGRGLNYPGSNDVILIHDHDYTNDIFFKCVRRYLEKGINFILP